MTDPISNRDRLNEMGLCEGDIVACVGVLKFDCIEWDLSTMKVVDPNVSRGETVHWEGVDGEKKLGLMTGVVISTDRDDDGVTWAWVKCKDGDRHAMPTSSLQRQAK